MLNQRVVDEIRRLFLDGATPSKLMQHIAANHPDDPRLHFIILDYFKEAFQIPLLRNVVSGENYSPNAQHAHYNRDVVPDMIQNAQDWNSDGLNGTWLDGLVVRSSTEHQTRLSNFRFEELDRVWETLNTKEKQFIIGKIAMKDYYWDVMKCLALLAERLQEKIVELEKRVDPGYFGNSEVEHTRRVGKPTTAKVAE